MHSQTFTPEYLDIISQPYKHGNTRNQTSVYLMAHHSSKDLMIY